MRPFALLLVPAALIAGQARFARLGEFQGKVEVQMGAADPWMPAERNLPIQESAWLRTGPAARLEIELDEGGAWRLGPDSQGEVSDYTRLSTGQRVTLLSLDHGVAYFTGEPLGKDSLSLAVPGAQIVFVRGARVRLVAQETASEIMVIEGSVKVSSPELEVTVAEGQSMTLDPMIPARFSFSRKIEAMDLDVWSEDRDKALFQPSSAGHVPELYGVADLDGAGEWVQTADLGDVWKPKAANGWAPFQKGRWRWYNSTGYTWVSDDPWGWLPYHYGRWTRRENLGWVWAPSKSRIFKPGDVYWLRGAKLAGWGPLAPGEEWASSSTPAQFLEVNTTYAAFVPDARVIDPAGFSDRPKEPLGVAVFALALPSPALTPSRLEAVRPPLRAGSTRVTPVLPGVTYDPSAPPTDTAASRPPAVVTNPAAADPPVVVPGPPPDAAPPLPVDIMYPAPVLYEGVVVINPPENTNSIRARRSQPAQAAAPAAQPAQPRTPAAAMPVTPRGQGAATDIHRPPVVTAAPAPVQVAPATPATPVTPVTPRGQTAPGIHNAPVTVSTPAAPAPRAAPAARPAPAKDDTPSKKNQ